MVRGWNFGMYVQGTSLRAVASSVPSLQDLRRMRALVALALVVVAVSTDAARNCAVRRGPGLDVTFNNRYKYFTCVNSGWSQWAESSHTECSKSCETGSYIINETRTCTNPPPSGFGAKPCKGENNRTRTANCNTQPCLGDGGWTNWSGWKATTDCSVLCGGGEVSQKRVRTCTNPSPSATGKPCEGEGKETRTIACNLVECRDKCVGKKDSVFAAPDPHQYYQCTYGNDGIAKAYLKNYYFQCSNKGVDERLTCSATDTNSAWNITRYTVKRTDELVSTHAPQRTGLTVKEI